MFWILIALFVIGVVYWKIIVPHQYWTKRGVKQGKQVILLGDNAGNIFKTESFSDMVQSIYSKFPNERYSGAYQFLRPMLVIRDPELIKQITVKDFDHFTDHSSFIPEEYEPLWTTNLFSLTGDKWREMRATLSPAFTSSKMRAMFTLMSECSEQFTNYFLENKNENVIELKDTFTRFTNDVIATCAFGVKCDSLKERNNEFYLMGKEATDFTSSSKQIKMMLYMLTPILSKVIDLKLFSTPVANFFRTLVADTVKIREEHNIVRPDMINLLMEARKGKLVYDEKQQAKETGFATVEESDIGKVTTKGKMEITDEIMTAQALIFFFAGFDSVSTLMCFMGYELAVNPEIQDRLRREIDESLKESNRKISYESINKMKYLDMVVTETLRKWPAGNAVDRVCIDSYTIPAKNPGEVDVHLKKGDYVFLPIWGFHRDPQYFPNPEKFDPERFNDDNKGDIQPYTYMPFGLGPRNCIGSRFALMETKIMFVHLLSKLELHVNEKTQIPIKLIKTGFSMVAEGGLWLGIKPRNN